MPVEVRLPNQLRDATNGQATVSAGGGSVVWQPATKKARAVARDANKSLKVRVDMGITVRRPG